MPDLEWNSFCWDGSYSWKAGGEEWSEVWASSMTPPSELSRPPSKAVVTFLRSTAGNENGSRLSSIMAGVARCDPGKGLASATESYARSVS